MAVWLKPGDELLPRGATDPLKALVDDFRVVVVNDAPLMIDEVQRGGDRIVLSVKRRVDVDNRGGQYILAGSTRFLTVPTLFRVARRAGGVSRPVALLKLRSLTDDSFEIFHYRDRDKREIDFILELPDNRVLAVEVKATRTPSTDHLRQLRWLRGKLGDQLVAGVLLYLGDEVLSFGNGILAAPVSILWDHEPLPG